jgi:chromosome segregation ATPase
MKALLSLFVFLFLLAPAVRLPADDASAEASFQTRMRETLRNTMQQLNDAQNQVAILQVAQAQSDKDKADLTAKVDALNAQLKTLAEQSAADRDTAAKSIATLNDQVATQKKQLAAFTEALAQWKVAYNQMAQLAKNTEEARAMLAADKILLQRLVDDRELKNAELYKTGTEILDRYEKFSLGDAITAKEPFVGVTRVRLQNLVQDYQDKLLDERISPGQPPTTPPPPAAKPVQAGVKTAQSSPTLEKVSP